MSQYIAQIAWEFSGADFRKGQYSREHTWTFDGGLTVPASSSPSVVPLPFSNASNVDPEEAYVASIASCHMLTFLYLASREGIEITRYTDRAVGTMTKNADGAQWISEVTLHPDIGYRASASPTREQEDHLHERAHQDCYIANSVKTEIRVAPSE